MVIAGNYGNLELLRFKRVFPASGPLQSMAGQAGILVWENNRWGFIPFKKMVVLKLFTDNRVIEENLSHPAVHKVPNPCLSFFRRKRFGNRIVLFKERCFGTVHQPESNPGIMVVIPFPGFPVRSIIISRI